MQTPNQLTRNQIYEMQTRDQLERDNECDIAELSMDLPPPPPPPIRPFHIPVPVPEIPKNIQLPDKYQTLDYLFKEMVFSIELRALYQNLPMFVLGLKFPTFGEISARVESRTKIKFLHSHLAQMKYVFPEAINVEKILVLDYTSLRMNPDMKIDLSLNIGMCSRHPADSPYTSLCKSFNEKLTKIFLTSPEDADIPEALLPEPFNRASSAVLQNGPSGKNPRSFSPNVIVSETKVTQRTSKNTYDSKYRSTEELLNRLSINVPSEL